MRLNLYMNDVLMRKIIFITVLLLLEAAGVYAQHYDRGYDAVPSTVFIKKGTWMAGGTVKYSQHLNEDYKFLIIEDINSKGYNISMNPKALYMFKDNMGAGLRLSYDRSMTDLASAGFSIADISMNAKDCYQIQHKYGAYGVFRAYIPFSGVKRIALYADLLLGGSFKQGKAFNAGGSEILGNFKTAYSLELAVDPGIVFFFTDNLAMEMNVGVFGVNYSWNNQVFNQVSTGYSDSASAGFMINLLSIGVGLSYYFHK